MSHSSKLMTLRHVANQLVGLIQSLSSKEMTIEEYCSLFDILKEISRLEQCLESTSLTLELNQDEEGRYLGRVKWELIPYSFKWPTQAEEPV